MSSASGCPPWISTAHAPLSFHNHITASQNRPPSCLLCTISATPVFHIIGMQWLSTAQHSATPVSHSHGMQWQLSAVQPQSSITMDAVAAQHSATASCTYGAALRTQMHSSPYSNVQRLHPSSPSSHSTPSLHNAKESKGFTFEASKISTCNNVSAPLAKISWSLFIK